MHRRTIRVTVCCMDRPDGRPAGRTHVDCSRRRPTGGTCTVVPTRAIADGDRRMHAYYAAGPGQAAQHAAASAGAHRTRADPP